MCVKTEERTGERQANAENAVWLLRRKLRETRFPEHGRITFELTIRNGLIERPRLVMDDSDDERAILGL